MLVYQRESIVLRRIANVLRSTGPIHVESVWTCFARRGGGGVKKNARPLEAGKWFRQAN